MNEKLLNEVLVAFDTETSGAWPIGNDIVEFGAIKWHQGKEIGRMQYLLKPRTKMSDFIMGIHGITNEMVENAPPFSVIAEEARSFFDGCVLMAHHAPFDLGFVAVEFEKAGLSFPQNSLLCTSLLARKLIHGTPNHKLQTLVSHLKIDGGNAHRAFDDAKSCLEVGLHCMHLLGEEASVARAIECQGKELLWSQYAIYSQNQDPKMQPIIAAIESQQAIEFSYDRSPARRQAKPIGLVRNPDGDFMQALCLRDQVMKRFYLQKIQDPKLVRVLAKADGDH